MKRTLRFAFLALALTIACPVIAAERPEAKVVELTLEDQFEKKHSIGDYKGQVLILVFGDRGGIDASKELGEKLHVSFHPTAAGQPPEKARKAAVAPLDGLPKGAVSPGVAVVPVAGAGSVPGPIKGLIRAGLKKDAAEVPVWLDFGTAMSEKFGLREGQPNIAVIDAQGRLRFKVIGTPTRADLEKVLQTTQNLRAEAAGLR